MNLLVFTSLLCFVVCGTLGTQGSDTAISSELAGVTGGPTSGEDLQGSLSNDEDLEEELSGGDSKILGPHGLPPSRDGRRGKKGKGKKNKQKSKGTTPFNPEHTTFTSGHTPTASTREDPCTSTHLSYCVHGHCNYIEGLREPVCICMKEYHGERCEIQALGATKTEANQRSNAELVQTVLVVIAVVLSVISCTAILLLTCAQSHKHFLASYLGTGAEQEKLKKPIADVVV